MAPDVDLSNIPISQADLWIFLQVDAIFDQIITDQAERLGSPPVLANCLISVMPDISQARLSWA
jgi:hypothetical protein